jgi:hypothetical protein
MFTPFGQLVTKMSLGAKRSAISCELLAKTGTCTGHLEARMKLALAQAIEFLPVANI